MVDAIQSMFCDYYCKYSPFVFPLFVGIGVELDEGLEVTTCQTNGRSKSIDMDVGIDGRTEMEEQIQE
jgi:hypothetical protein